MDYRGRMRRFFTGRTGCHGDRGTCAAVGAFVKDNVLRVLLGLVQHALFLQKESV
jgi:hypothetical protein